MLCTAVKLDASQIETSGDKGTHAVFSEPRCLCWCLETAAGAESEPELIDGTTGYLAASTDPGCCAIATNDDAADAAARPSRFCSQAALAAFAALSDAARDAHLAPDTLPPTAAARSGSGSGGDAPPHHRHLKSGWREPEYSQARELLLARTIFRAWPQCKSRGRGWD